MNDKKFDPKKLAKLNNPQRLIDIPPDFIRGKLDLEQPDTIVEIGAGTAFFCIAFLQKWLSSTIYACDLSDVMINWMQENVVHQYPSIVPIKTQENSVPLDDGLADLVFMINLHHELDNPSAVINEANRLLKNDGKIFIVDWKKEDMPEGPPTKIRCLSQDVGDQLREAGFQQISIYNDLEKHFLIVGQKLAS